MTHMTISLIYSFLTYKMKILFCYDFIIKGKLKNPDSLNPGYRIVFLNSILNCSPSPFTGAYPYTFLKRSYEYLAIAY